MGLKSWVFGIIGKKMQRDVGLKEGNVDKKKWYLSKTIWAAVVAAVFGVIDTYSSVTGATVNIPGWIYTVLGLFGVYARASADKKIG